MTAVKFGGSLIKHAKTVLTAFKELNEISENVIIVPGGGIFADLIRKAQKEYKISDSAAHEMALLAMEQYGVFLSDVSGIACSKNLSHKRPFILLPSETILGSALEKCWSITGDTIACYIAWILGEEFIKLTDVNGIAISGKAANEIEAEKLFNLETCVDKALPGFLIEKNINCRVASGKDIESIKKALKGKTGTLIKGGK